MFIKLPVKSIIKYIWQTTESLDKRFKRNMGYQKDEHDTKFYRAIRKYGKEK